MILNIGFGLKKQGENNDIRTPSHSTCTDNIRTIYGNQIARFFFPFGDIICSLWIVFLF